MPNIKSAKKKLRKDIKRTKINLIYKKALDREIKNLKRMLGSKSSQDGVNQINNQLKKAYSIIDKTAKKRMIHRNKAARLKSWISKLVAMKK